jgi:hypothetical protein
VNVVLSPPTIAKVTTVSSGATNAGQPITLSVPAPQFADGTPFTQTVTGPNGATSYVIAATAAKATYSFGALAYRLNADGTVQIFDGQKTWNPESSFDAYAPGVKAAEYALDATKGTWSATFVLATAPDFGSPSFATSPPSNRPQYGFLSYFRTPKTPAAPADATCFRSARGAPFAVAPANPSTRVQPGPVQGTTPTTDISSADGFAVFVNDASGLQSAELLLSSDGSLAETVVLSYLQGGVPRASISIEPGGTLHLVAATGTVIDAPVVTINGTLQAQAIRYVPFGSTTETTL